MGEKPKGSDLVTGQEQWAACNINCIPCSWSGTSSLATELVRVVAGKTQDLATHSSWPVLRLLPGSVSSSLGLRAILYFML